jgi:hypothetical protein
MFPKHQLALKKVTPMKNQNPHQPGIFPTAAFTDLAPGVRPGWGFVDGDLIYDYARASQ